MSRNTLILLLNNMTAAVLAFILVIIVTRNFGKVGFGQYATIMAWITPLVVIMDGGINTLINRDVAKYPGASASYLRQAWQRRLARFLIVIPAGWFIAPLLSDDKIVIIGLRIGICYAFVDALLGSYNAVFRAWERMEPIWILNIGYFSIQIAGTLLVVRLGGTIAHKIIVIVIADTLQLIAAFKVWRYFEPKYEPTPIELTKDVKARSFFVAGLLAIFQMRLMIYQLNQFMSLEQLGLYATANRFVDAARMVPNALFAALFPRLSFLVTQPRAFKQLLYFAYIGVTAYALLVGSLSILGGKFALEAAFGSGFDEAAPILSILAWGLIPALLRALFTLRMYAYQEEAVVNGFLVVTIVGQLILGWILIPAYGLVGAAWTVIAGETLLAVSLFSWIEKDWLLRLVAMRRNR